MTPRIRRSIATLLVLTMVVPAARAHKVCLWEIDTATARLYLLGSIHAVKPDLYPLPGPMESAFRHANTLVFEVDMSRVSPLDIADAMNKRGHYPPGQSIGPNLAPQTRKLLSAWLHRHNISYDSIAHTRPWLLALNLEMRELQRLGYQPSLGIDQYFLDRARKSGKRIVALETWQAQVDMLSADPDDVQDTELRATLDELDQAEARIASLVNAWQQGDVDQMYRLSVESTRKYPRLAGWTRRLTVERNRRMADKIRGYLAQGGQWLVVVGVLHMGGEEGIVNLLRRDYAVNQISVDSTSPTPAADSPH